MPLVPARGQALSSLSSPLPDGERVSRAVETPTQAQGILWRTPGWLTAVPRRASHGNSNPAPLWEQPAEPRPHHHPSRSCCRARAARGAQSRAGLSGTAQGHCCGAQPPSHGPQDPDRDPLSRARALFPCQRLPGAGPQGLSRDCPPSPGTPLCQVPVNQGIFQKCSSLCLCRTAAPLCHYANGLIQRLFQETEENAFSSYSNETLAQEVPKQCQASKSSGAQLVITLQYKLQNSY